MRKRSGGGEEGGGGHDGGGSLRWLLTYADMITLLMAFFIMMYSMSVLNLAKFREAAISIRSGFGGIMPGQGPSILGSTGQMSVRPSPIAGDSTGIAWQIVKPVQTLIRETPMIKDNARIYMDHRGLVLSLASDKVLFAPGSADIRPEARSVLTNIAQVLRSVPNEVRVEGHTCNLPTRSGSYPSNWELSTARATNVVRYLIGSGNLSPRRISAAGFADTRPVVPNDYEEHRRLNRRVDFVILRTPEGGH